ncbi:MAG TPA: NAD(P)/FAD-dependent oxidoreductase [Granulicella sp.]|nr:NAD(P)/FAD-dependent oxidoreductase [Granulicella sp.]
MPPPASNSHLKHAAVIGAGPNGLSAAITLAQAGIATTLFEAGATVGGAVRTAEITLPGFHHDLGASVFPLGAASPFFNSLPLPRYGHRWIEPPAPLAHPLDDGSAVMLEHDLTATCTNLAGSGGHPGDAAAYRTLLQPLVDDWPSLNRELLGPILHLPHSPLLLARFGLYAMLPAATLARSAFKGSRARALLAGLAAHSVMPLTAPLSSAVGLVLAAAGHTTGWPIAAGGAQSLSNALAAHLESLGGVIHLNHPITTLDQAEPADAILCDITPRQLRQIAATDLEKHHPAYARRLARYRYGPGVYKIDWALSDPIPWTARDCARAATVHLGGSLEEIVAAEAAPWKRDSKGSAPPKPFVLLVQPSLFDPSRAPAGRHTAWAYCHVPNGSTVSVAAAIEAQVARFAPGFEDCILARSVMPPSDLEEWNPNLVGGDISGGAMTPWQLLARPTPSLYRTALPKVFLCSSSTPPGGGVHGMCGHLAARLAKKL